MGNPWGADQRTSLFFLPPDDNMTQSQYHSGQCIAKAQSSGERCRLRTARGKKCWLHTRRDEGLRVKASAVTEAGLGLYTTRPMKKGTSIKYTGEELTRAQVDRRYGDETAQYTLCRSAQSCRDGRRSDEPGMARWINDSRGTSHRSNVKLTGAYTAKATRNIGANRELFASYGREYWGK